MNAKDLRTDSALGGHNNDGSTKYAQSGNSLQNNCKSYQDIGANPLAKVDVQTSRPCAIIGPDRILPSPNCNDGFAKKIISETWPCSDNIYRQPPDYPHKMSEYQPPRNISPRQTFQENMQRIMVSPYNSAKKVDESNFPMDRNVTMLKNVKVNLPSEAKYCDVPYTIGPACNEQKSLRVAEIPVTNLNPGIARNGPHGWPSNNIRPLRPYGAPELYQYSDYPSCAGPRPMPMIRPHRTVQEEPSRLYPEQYYQDPNVRFRPYPSKGRYPPGRYDYISNYPNSFHTPFPPHAFDPQKSAPPHSYPLYPQVPIKYIDRRMGEPIMDGYQRPSPQANLNVAYRNQIIHPSYGPLQPNCIQNNVFPYPSDSSKSVMSNKLPYTNNNKLYLDYEASQIKKISVSDSVYSNDANHTNSLKGEVIYPNYTPVNMHGISQLPLYRKENVPMKNFDYVPHLRNLDPSVNFHNPLLRHPIHFSPTAVAISPSDSNTSNDTAQTHVTQEDCGYVSQSSTTSARSLDSHINGFPGDHHIYKSPDYRYGYLPRNVTAQVPNNSKSSKVKKDLNVRQFLQMWNEGDDEPNEQNKEDTLSKSNDELKNLQSHHDTANKQEQLYVLGLVNVPSEELGKYDHIQKISKLPENIKGYNNIELLNQFEEAIESTNMRPFNLKPQKDYHAPLKSTVTKQPMNAIPRPVSPLDVEAKISQSVIHKEVGCNFEIKPCSPKMLNVEIATPIQNILDERIIEKISNPIASKSNVLHKTDKTSIEKSFPNVQNSNCENPSKDIIASCSMDNLQFRNDNSLDPTKQNYNLQYLEYSSVSLASLPRLDNDIELNFPEINQQFINSNNMEPVNSPTPVKDLPILDSDQKDRSDTNKIEKSNKLSHFSPNSETENNVPKLSKYRKLRKTDLESKERQLSPIANTQFRTDSVIIKNPDINKSHENDCSIIRDCNADNEHITKKQDLVGNDSITSPHTPQDETSMICLNKSNVDKEQCNILPKINNEVEQSSFSPDIAIDFSLNKSNSESMEDCPLKENTSVNDSLLNLIDEELNISEAFDKAELSTSTSYNISNETESSNSDDKTNSQLLNDLGQEEFSDKILPSQSDVTETHDKKSHTLQPQNELLYNSDGINLSTSTDAVDSILDSNLNKNDTNLAEHNNTQDSISIEDSENITQSISCQPEELDCSDKNKYSDHSKENYLTIDNDFESNIYYHDLSEKQRDVQIDDSNLMVPINTTIASEVDCSNNSETFKVEFKVPSRTSEEAKLESDVMSLDIQSDSKNENNKCSEHLDGSMLSPSKNFYFNKRLYSNIIQNLIIRNEEVILKEKKSNSISIKDDYLNRPTLPIFEKLEEVSENSMLTDSNITEDISVHKNDTNVFSTSPTSDSTVVQRYRSNEDLKSPRSSIIDTMPECVDNPSEKEKLIGSELDDNSMKDNGVENFNTDYSSNNKDTETLNFESTEECCNKNEEKQLSNNIEEEIISKPEVSIDRRLRLKRSLSDSAINMYTNDDIKPMNSENIYTITRKRKKINPCEMMEPHLIAQNLCDIIQTNRRNSISTLYDEENVSFCILIDNSCVITEDIEEEQKICLAEISEDAYENEFKNDCTFATEGIIFTNEITNNETCSVNEDIDTNTKIDTESDSIGDVNDFVQENPVDQNAVGKTIDEESWIEDVACVETVFSDNIAENVVLDAPYSPSDSILDFETEEKNESLIYNDTENMEKIKCIYGNEMCTDDAELVETLYRTPQMDVTKTLIRRESHYSDENNRYYDNDSLEKVLSESNDRSEYEPDIKCYNIKNTSPNTLKEQHDRDRLNSKSPLENVVNNKSNFIDSDYEDNLDKALENTVYQPTQYDIVHSCESTCDSSITYHHKDESPRYSSSPEVSSTTSEEKSCGILLKITKCNGSISSQINEFNTKSTSKISSKLSENNELVNYPRTRPLLTKAAQKYIPPLKETIRHLKVKLPLPQNSLNKLKLLKIAKEKPKLDERHIKNNDLLKHHYPKKNKPKFEDVLKSIDEIQIKMHKEKNKKHKHSIPKVVIKKNENGAHYASTSSDRESYNPDLTGRKWQPWVFIEKNYFVDKMALNNKVKAVYSYRKNTYVLAEKFRKYKSVNNAKFIITPPKLEDISSGKLKYTIRLNHNY
ncbi:hypothetical protein RR48_08817 [Papilio machaon]|uniref:Uncharacterized protein n=1 Tax=Papilio machaon TaxID=76193 RepID=A0A194R0K1_PAPMA|nr:hypothetical protein RR48_08817 [Papilio machaon]